jgi:hypothetical protein
MFHHVEERRVPNFLTRVCGLEKTFTLLKLTFERKSEQKLTIRLEGSQSPRWKWGLRFRSQEWIVSCPREWRCVRQVSENEFMYCREFWRHRSKILDVRQLKVDCSNDDERQHRLKNNYVKQKLMIRLEEPRSPRWKWGLRFRSQE